MFSIREQGVTAADVDRVVIHASTHTVDHVGWPYVPDTLTTAQMNLSYAVACAFLDGKVGAEQFTPERLTDPAVLALAERIQAVPDPGIDARGLSYSHAISMEVHTKDGRRFTAAYDHGRGSEHWPLSDDEIKDKFRDQASRVLSEARVDEIVDAVDHLESLDDITELVDLTTVGAKADV